MSLFSSPSASQPFTGIVGTLIGFTCGIYMPLTLFPKGMSNFAGIIPFTHMQVMLKRVMIMDSVKLMNIPDDVLESLWPELGANQIDVFGIDMPPYLKIIYISIVGIIFLFSSVLIISKKIKK
jgi:multidrug/hemolysin transport system permease protein